MSDPREPGSFTRTLRYWSRRPGVVALAAACALAAPLLYDKVPDSPLLWLLFVVAVGGGIYIALVGVLSLSSTGGVPGDGVRKPDRHEHGPAAGVLVFAFPEVVVLLVAVGLGVALPPLLHYGQVYLRGCPPATQLQLLTTPEGLQTAHELTAAFERHALDGTRCAQVAFYSYALRPADVLAALSDGWNDEDLAQYGPRPDFWLPGSSFFSVPPHPTLSNVEVTSIGSARIVLAVPDELAGGAAGMGPRVPWSQALKQPDGQWWPVARPDPVKSFPGLAATTAVYQSLAAAGNFSAVDFERRIDAVLDQGGYPLGDELDLLCHHLGRGGANAAPVAFMVTDWQVRRFNAERPLGGSCATLASSTHGKHLTPIEPTDTKVMDYPLVRLEWTGGSSLHRDRSRAFSAWLADDEGRQVLRDAGLRDPQPALSQQDLVAAKADYARAKRPGRVLLALDTSGSMRELMADGTSYFTAAKRGVVSALDRMGQQDEFGLLPFPQGALLPLQAGAAQRDQARSALERLRPTGQNTPLYDTVARGVELLRTGDAGAIRALVVLTDGDDEGSRLTLEAMLEQVRNSRVRVLVVAVGVASCASRALSRLAQQTSGSCEQVGSGSPDAALSNVFDVLWKGA